MGERLTVRGLQAEAAADRLRRFGSRLRDLRGAQGLSQEHLANRAGLHRTYVGSVERGERNISLLNIYALADALQLDAADLLASEIEKG